ncbi:hypothetical protein MPSEU_000572100 [Mayamaea pseudoterrestris]|nr:hypothetical protein MPSEU_000572100 [Mayamaea pseudoterrestris]
MRHALHSTSKYLKFDIVGRKRLQRILPWPWFTTVSRILMLQLLVTVKAFAGRRTCAASVHRMSLSSINLSYTGDTDLNIAPSTAYQRRMRLLQDSSKLSLAPMMDYTDRHFRYLVRLISQRTLVYTEMVAANAIAHERREAMEKKRFEHPNRPESRSSYDDQFLQRYLSQAPFGEGPSVLQLGGSSPVQLFESAQAVMDMEDRGYCNYTAINLNCGCPSPKVAGKGSFGASLMDDANLVAQLTSAMYQGCDGRMPITVKCRIGTETQSPYTHLSYVQTDPEQEYRKLANFIRTVARNGVVTDFQVHARIAVLSKSFSPADNRKVPPLKYDLVRRLVQDFPELTFSLNGGIDSISQALNEFQRCPGLMGVMVGRAFAASPWNFAMADQLMYGDNGASDEQHRPMNRLQILEAYGKHADYEESIWDPVKIRRFIVKAITPLFAGEPNAKKYRIALERVAGSAKALHLQGKTTNSQPPLSELILTTAMEHLTDETLLRSPQESYERLLFEDGKQLTGIASSMHATSEWQDERKNICNNSD